MFNGEGDKAKPSHATIEPLAYEGMVERNHKQFDSIMKGGEHLATHLKIHTCTSLVCSNFDCDYCSDCSHAVFVGMGFDINNKMRKWEFNPYFGPLFLGEKGEPLKKQPISPNHPAWLPFTFWHYRFSHNKIHPLINVLNNMKFRCYNKKSKQYHRYGGRGITVCKEWLENPKVFYSFALKKGWSSELQIDRRNNNGNYTPDNCRFVTRIVNNQNRIPTPLEVKTRINNAKKRKKTVMNISTKEIFESAAYAARCLGFRENAVRKAINQGYRCGGYYWEYI